MAIGCFSYGDGGFWWSDCYTAEQAFWWNLRMMNLDRRWWSMLDHARGMIDWGRGQP